MKHPIDSLHEWQLGWLAGIIDGEGCVTLSVQPQHNNHIGAHVDVGMTDELTIRAICQITGLGSVYLMSNRGKKRRQLYRWHITSFVEVITFLRKVLPYLLTKRMQAGIVLGVCERRLMGMGQSLKDERAVKEIRVLNLRGLREEVEDGNDSTNKSEAK